MDTLTYDQMMDSYGFIPFNHQKPNFFPVDLRPIFDHTGKEIPGHVAVQRGDSGDVLAVHSDKYSMVPYEQHFQIFEEAIGVSASARLTCVSPPTSPGQRGQDLPPVSFPRAHDDAGHGVLQKADRAAHLHVR
jgi:hypothetical protein